MTKLFVDNFFFDRRHPSFLKVFIHMDISVILSLVVFKFFLIFAGLAAAMVF
jgi:hypothetical protein